MKPTGKHIVLKVEKKEDKTVSGIIIPDSVDIERPSQAQVVAVGKDVVEISAGQTVIFKKYAPDEVEVNGETHLIVQEKDIMAIL